MEIMQSRRRETVPHHLVDPRLETVRHQAPETFATGVDDFNVDILAPGNGNLERQPPAAILSQLFDGRGALARPFAGFKSRVVERLIAEMEAWLVLAAPVPLEVVGDEGIRSRWSSKVSVALPSSQR